MIKKIVLTGGGTAGHVNPNLALVPFLVEREWQVSYIGSYEGIEKELVRHANLPYYGIASGKLRRYFDWQNFSDPFRVLQGLAEAYGHLRTLRPQLIFSKGGFVTVPVILAGWLLSIPIVIHESDYSPGLANRLALPFASQVWVTFPETQSVIPQALVTGLPIRQELLQGCADRGRALCGFERALPVVMVVGGSTGSAKINQSLRALVPQLADRYQVVHLCGKGNLDSTLNHFSHYCQFEYLEGEMKDVLSLADLVISRAGANALFEFLTLKKPNLLIPLSKAASRGDQILNAQSFAQAGFSQVLMEESLTPQNLLSAMDQLFSHRGQFSDRMGQSPLVNPIPNMVQSFEALLDP